MYDNKKVLEMNIESKFKSCKAGMYIGLSLNPYYTEWKKNEIKREFDNTCDMLESIMKSYYGIW